MKRLTIDLSEYKNLSKEELLKKLENDPQMKLAQERIDKRLCPNCGRKLHRVGGDHYSYYCVCNPDLILSIG